MARVKPGVGRYYAGLEPEAVQEPNKKGLLAWRLWEPARGWMVGYRRVTGGYDVARKALVRLSSDGDAA